MKVQKSRRAGDDANDLTAYLRGIEREPVLTRDTIVKLTGRYQASKDPEALSRIVRSNMRMVLSIAHRFTGHGVELQDLMQEGCFGLIQAALGFRSKYNTAFSTYAYPWIEVHMRRAVETQGTKKPLRIPSHKWAICRIILQHMPAFETLHGRAPDVQELLAWIKHRSTTQTAAKLTLKNIQDGLKVLDMRRVGMDTESQDDDVRINRAIEAQMTHAHMHAPAWSQEEIAEGESHGTHIWEIATRYCNTRELTILKAHLREEKTLEIVGRNLEVSRERIRQIEARAIRKIAGIVNMKPHVVKTHLFGGASTAKRGSASWQQTAT